MVCAELSKHSDSVRLVDRFNKTKTFPSGSSSIIFYFNFTDGNVSLETGMSFIASLQVGDPESVLLGTPNQATINVLYDEGRYIFSVLCLSDISICLKLSMCMHKIDGCLKVIQ